MISMRKIILALVILVILAVSSYLLYRSLVPQIIARAVVSDSLPDYIPKRLQMKVEEIRRPLNRGTDAMLRKMHASNISVDQVLKAVDDISEDEAYAFLDEVNATKPANTDELFSVAKKHFSTDFDLEIFREPFNQHFEMKQINNAINYANMNRKSNDVDIATAKAILKKIIVEKEKEVLDR
jgi:hypothetical protein